MNRPHWSNCIAHFDNEVEDFVGTYFGEQGRRCLLVAAAGFDPRSQRVAGMLAAVLGNRLSAIFVREERASPDGNLVLAGDQNEAGLRSIIPSCTVIRVEVFGDDGAAVGGPRIAALLDHEGVPEGVTDVVLDLSVLSIGIGFPMAKMLLSDCEAVPGRSFHILVVSNPELDDLITSEPADLVMPVKGFAGVGHLGGMLDTARIWVPQLARGRNTTLRRIGAAIGNCYKICPVLPFPSRDPRRADNLVGEYEDELANEWEVDPRDLVYVSERNPLDCYRVLSTLKQRYDRTVDGTFEPSIVLSPVGSKVMATGALMAAIEHDLSVQYLETIRYEFQPTNMRESDPPDMMVHVLLSGPVYKEYFAAD